MSDEPLTIEPPRRRDGTFKAFWYDPRIPRHIFHRDKDGDIRTICVGHSD